MLDILALVQVSAAIIGISPFVFFWIRMKKYSKRPLEIPRESVDFPSLTIVVPVWNEEMVLSAKLDDLVKQDYPKDRMEILVIDSHSSDSTMEIFSHWKSIQSPELNVRSIQMPSHRGKSAAINRLLMEPLNTDVFVITDADALLAPGALKRIGRWFSDQRIGAVCGTQKILGNSNSEHFVNEKTYRSFYHDLRIGESAISSSPIFEGSLAAYRNSLVLGQQIDQTYNADDSQLAILINRNGSRSIMDPELHFFEYLPSTSDAAKKRRLRRANGLVHLFSRNPTSSISTIDRKFTMILRMESWAHLRMPFFVLISIAFMLCHMSYSIYSVAMDIFPQPVHTSLLFIDLLLLIMLLLGNNFRLGRILRAFVDAQWTLLVANIGMYMGVDFRIWEQDIESRKSLIEE